MHAAVQRIAYLKSGDGKSAVNPLPATSVAFSDVQQLFFQEAWRSSRLYLQNHHGLVIENRGSRGKIGSGLEDGIRNFLGRFAGVFINYMFHANAAKLF